jgi:hypothetical protein
MRAAIVPVLAFASVLLLSGAVSAQMRPVEVRERAPGAAALAATGNILFMPIRLAITTFGAGVGGLTGWVNGGDAEAAHDVWQLVDGQGFLQPDMISGKEPIQLGDLEFRMHVTDAP